MLGKYIKINGEIIPNPTTYSESLTDIENVNQSEGGTDIVSTTRLGKYNSTMSFQISSYWKEKLREYTKKPTVVIEVDGVIYTVRLRAFSATLEANSESVRNTQGYWNVSVQAIEI